MLVGRQSESVGATAQQPTACWNDRYRASRKTTRHMRSTHTIQRGDPVPRYPVVEYRQSVEPRSERKALRLNVSLRSNVISAVIGGVIYLVIYLATGGGVAGAIIGAVIFAVIVFLIASGFGRLIAPRLR